MFLLLSGDFKTLKTEKGISTVTKKRNVGKKKEEGIIKI
jgi:hypothetical protein